MHYTALSYLRAKKGLTQAELAAMSGVHRVTISKMEHGMKLQHLPSIDAIAKALGATREEVLEEKLPEGYAPPASPMARQSSSWSRDPGHWAPSANGWPDACEECEHRGKLCVEHGQLLEDDEDMADGPSGEERVA